eukprot:2334214-Rhodomonas_salina.1
MKDNQPCASYKLCCQRDLLELISGCRTFPLLLRRRYAVSGTAIGRTTVLHSPYAMCGTAIGSSATVNVRY